jgi:hypothetical protein
MTKKRGAWHWGAWNREEARRAGQLEMPLPRAEDPRAKAERAEKLALRRQRLRKRRMGVFG